MIATFAFANSKIDSLLNILPVSEPEEVLAIYLQLSEETVDSVEMSSTYATKAIPLADSLNDRKAKAKAHYLLGKSELRKNNYAKAIHNLDEAMFLLQEDNDFG